MNVSDAGLEFIKLKEGVVLHAYDDPSNFCTVGVGHLLNPDNPRACTQADYDAWRGMTVEDALELLRQDVIQFEDAINSSVTVPLNQTQFDALCSFAFNVGVTAFTSSTLVWYLNQGDFENAALQFLRWVYSGGVALPGLLTRRQDEARLFTDGVYGFEVPPVSGNVTPAPAPWATVVKAGDADVGFARDIFFQGFGIPFIDSRDSAKLAETQGAIYLGRADAPVEPWTRHKYTVQLTGRGIDRSVALMKWLAAAMRVSGLPPL